MEIKHRAAYNCRHTYATTALAAGVAPRYISTHMWHVNTIVRIAVYSRWFIRADKGFKRPRWQQR